MAAKPGETQRRQSKTSVVPTPCSKIKESHLEKLMEQFQSPSCQEPGECSFVYFWGKRSKVLNQNKWKDWLIISTSDVGVTGRPGVSHCLYADFLYSHPYFLNLRVVGVGDLKLLCFSVSTVLITPLGVNSLSKDTECFINASFGWILSGRLFPSSPQECGLSWISLGYGAVFQLTTSSCEAAISLMLESSLCWKY